MAEPAAPGFPPALELEQWMMNTAKDGDRAASFLRRVLNMNPGYGQYLTHDEELSGIVQLFAKRFRQKILQAETPIQPATLWQPICEVVWRVVGLTLHSVIEMPDGQAQNSPVPKEAAGQVRMLLQANLELSNKLNEARRSYLRELSCHRDKQRKLSGATRRAVESLHEHPVMFFEPLQYVLDETTKEFVKEVVEERLKLEMRTGFTSDEANAEVAHHIDDLEQTLKLKEAEMRQLRNQAAREADARKRCEEASDRAVAEAGQAKQDAEEHLQELEAMRAKVGPLEWELSQKARRIAFFEGQLDEKADAKRRDSNPQLTSQMDAQLTEMSQLKQRSGELEDEITRLHEQLLAANEAVAKLEENPLVVQTEAEVAKDIVEAECLREQLEKSMDVEKELRAANKVLEAALAEEQEKLAALEKKEAKMTEKAGKDKSAKDLRAERDADQDEDMKAVQKIADAREKVTEQASEIERLTAELAAVAEEKKSFEKDAEKRRKEAEDAAAAGAKEDNKAEKLKRKLEEMEDKHEDLQHEYDKLEQKVRMLLDKLKEKCGDDEVKDVLNRIKLTPPPPKKRRKKKAFERLYDDAQRRLVDLKVKQEKVSQMEEQALVDAAAKAKDRKSMRSVAMLVHLQKAAKLTQERFHDAAQNFHDRSQHPTVLENISECENENTDQPANADGQENSRVRSLNRSASELSRTSSEDPGSEASNAARARWRGLQNFFRPQRSMASTQDRPDLGAGGHPASASQMRTPSTNGISGAVHEESFSASRRTAIAPQDGKVDICEHMIRLVDTNPNGKVSKTELRAGLQGTCYKDFMEWIFSERRFHVYDTDHSGRLELAELRKAFMQFSNTDSEKPKAAIATWDGIPRLDQPDSRSEPVFQPANRFISGNQLARENDLACRQTWNGAMGPGVVGPGDAVPPSCSPKANPPPPAVGWRPGMGSGPYVLGRAPNPGTVLEPVPISSPSSSSPWSNLMQNGQSPLQRSLSSRSLSSPLAQTPQTPGMPWHRGAGSPYQPGSLGGGRPPPWAPQPLGTQLVTRSMPSLTIASGGGGGGPAQLDGLASSTWDHRRTGTKASKKHKMASKPGTGLCITPMSFTSSPPSGPPP